MGRLENYQYLKIFRDHLGNDLNKVFNGEPILPRQLEVHLPSDRKTACNFNCFYCQGGRVARALGSWEEKGLTLMEKLQGRIPYYIYGGAYTEPLMNEFFPDYIKMTKKFNNHFGIHTNGSLFMALEEKNGFCSLLINEANSSCDYVSTSLDAGTVESHKFTKKVKEDWFSKILEGLRILTKLRGRKKYPSIRVCYLMNKANSSPKEIAGIVKIMQDIGVDSLRFSVPYDQYGKDFKTVKVYRNKFEIPFGLKYHEVVKPYLSKDPLEKPYVFWHPPGYQDVEKMTFKQCVYTYYQITYAADGYVYKCSSTASPSFGKNRLGKTTGDLDEFMAMVLANHNPDWDANTCFCSGARCNRIALEINEAWNKGTLNHEDLEDFTSSCGD